MCVSSRRVRKRADNGTLTEVKRCESGVHGSLSDFHRVEHGRQEGQHLTACCGQLPGPLPTVAHRPMIQASQGSGTIASGFENFRLVCHAENVSIQIVCPGELFPSVLGSLQVDQDVEGGPRMC